jgi:hypothetical protein
MSEGFAELIGDQLPADITGRVFSSLDLIDEWGLNVDGLDGLARV